MLENENGGSLTIIASALIDAGSRMDELIFNEFKGTGNMELVLSKKLAERGMWPAIDLPASDTPKEELLLGVEWPRKVGMLRRDLASRDPVQAMESQLAAMKKFPINTPIPGRLWLGRVNGARSEPGRSGNDHAGDAQPVRRNARAGVTGIQIRIMES